MVANLCKFALPAVPIAHRGHFIVAFAVLDFFDDFILSAEKFVDIFLSADYSDNADFAFGVGIIPRFKTVLKFFIAFDFFKDEIFSGAS